MTTLLTDGPKTHAAIRELFASAQTIKCAVAFWGAGAVSLFPTTGRRNIQVVCNLTTGGTNPAEIERLRELLGSEFVKMDNRLHAKVFWTENGVVLGSANASANGLAWEGSELTAWKEAGVLLREPDQIAAINKWFETMIWPAALPIGKGDLKVAQLEWKNRRKPRTGDPELSFEEALQRGNFSDRNIHIIINSEFLSIPEKKRGDSAASKLKRELPWLLNAELDFWLEYPKIPRNAIIFDFDLEEDGRIKFINSVRTFSKSTDRNKYQFATPIKLAEARMTLAQRREMQAAVTEVALPLAEKIRAEEGWEISIEEFAVLQSRLRKRGNRPPKSG